MSAPFVTPIDTPMPPLLWAPLSLNTSECIGPLRNITEECCPQSKGAELRHTTGVNDTADPDTGAFIEPNTPFCLIPSSSSNTTGGDSYDKWRKCVDDRIIRYSLNTTDKCKTAPLVVYGKTSLYSGASTGPYMSKGMAALVAGVLAVAVMTAA